MLVKKHKGTSIFSVTVYYHIYGCIIIYYVSQLSNTEVVSLLYHYYNKHCDEQLTKVFPLSWALRKLISNQGRSWTKSWDWKKCSHLLTQELNSKRALVKIFKLESNYTSSHWTKELYRITSSGISQYWFGIQAICFLWYVNSITKHVKWHWVLWGGLSRPMRNFIKAHEAP